MEIEEAIKKTLAYAKKFGMKLRLEELTERLIGKRVYKKSEIKRAVKNMGLRFERQIREATEKKMTKARRVAKMIAKNDKNVLFLGVTGSVAGGKAKEDDDIDMMVICKKNRLWWGRWKLKIFLNKKRIRQRKAGKKEQRNSFCFNLLLFQGNIGKGIF